MLVGEGESSKIVYNYLNEYFDILKVVEDTAISKKNFLIRRYKKLGFFKVFGQILFMIFNKLLMKSSINRIDKIKKENGLISDNYSTDKLKKVKSINNNDTIKILQKYNPDVVIVNGTRIISKKVLKCIDSVFINTHVGITPLYRGVHGGYWALVNKDYNNCGVTVHIVDEGIDTGGVIFQDIIEITKFDDFNTYPYLQITKALPLLKLAIEDVKNNSLTLINKSDVSSVLYSHPTIFDYFKNYLKGVK